MPGLLIAPGQSSYKSNNPTNTKRTQSEWSFNFRGGYESESGSSDEEPEASNDLVNASNKAAATQATDNVKTILGQESVKPEAETEDARLLRELDIDSRASTDAAQFTATPWSIARVNAASRAPLTTPESTSITTGSDMNEREAALAKVDTGPLDSGEGRKKVDTATAPKLGKTIEKFFATRKSGQSTSKCKPVARVINNQRIPRISSSDSYSSRPAQLGAINRPSLPSNRLKLKPRSPDSDHLLSHNRNKASVQSRPHLSSYPDIDYTNSIQNASGNVPSISTANSTQRAFSAYDNTTMDGSNFGARESEQFTNDLPSTDYLVAQSSLPSAAQYARPSTCANINDFDDNWEAGLIPRAQPEPQQPISHPANPHHSIFADSFSSPVRGSGEVFRLKLSSKRPAIGGLPSSTGPSNYGAPSMISNVHEAQKPLDLVHMAHPGYMRSFSSPLRQPARVAQHSGRSALRPNLPRLQKPHCDNNTFQLKRSRSPVVPMGYGERSLPQFTEQASSAERIVKLELGRNATHDVWPPIKEEIEYEMPVNQSDSAFEETDFVSSPKKRSLPPLLHRQRFSSPPSKRPYTAFSCGTEHTPGPTSREQYVHDAYGEDNGDEDWSTLPARKKARAQGSSSSRSTGGTKSMKNSGRFKLPIALPSLAAKTVSNVPTSVGKRRVITYLPPPREPAPKPIPTKRDIRQTVTPTVYKDKPLEERIRANKDVKKIMTPASEWSLKRFSYDSGPAVGNAGGLMSPLEERATKSEQPCNDTRLLKQEYVDDSELYDSGVRQEPSDAHASDGTDTTLCDSTNHFSNKNNSKAFHQDMHGDVPIAFDSTALERSYPEARRVMLERKAASAAVWDELGLPSCGVPFADPDPPIHTFDPYDPSMHIGPRYEIPIVVWSGIPEQHFGVT